MIELRVLRGAPGDEEVSAIVDLYGPADRKYTEPWFVRHQFAENPFGWSLHAFAVADGHPVGHCALLPLPARVGPQGETVASGKFEAFAVRPEYQSATLADGRLIGLGLLAELYARAEEAGFALLHDLAQPELGLMHRMHGARRVPVPWQTFVGAGDLGALRELGTVRAVAATALAVSQRALQLLSTPVSARAVTHAAAAGDEPPPPRRLEAGTWSVEAADMWDWLARSGLLTWMEEPSGGRALVRIPGPAAQPAELLDWRPGRRPLRGAVAVVSAVARLGRTGRNVRIANPSHDEHLRRAAQLLGFLPARDPLMLFVKSLRADLDPTSVAATPFFFATF